ncbi:MAG: hypothetical protein AN485_19250 [Anabaena sp. MDT14b]|jgi:hypothetical protein|nr:MAG: hypothetical protein AN485_19250 [Anabaena sp. MDT14b]
METPLFKLIESELISCREKIDEAINSLNEIDVHFTDKPDLALRLAKIIINEDDSRFIVEKINKLYWRLKIENLEEYEREKED